MMKFKGNLLLLICGVFALILSMSGVLKNYSHLSDRNNTKESTFGNGRPWNKKAIENQKQKRERYRLENRKEGTIEKAKRSPQPQKDLPKQSSGQRAPKSKYQILWDECEYLEAILNETGIYHEDLSESMDYHDLKNLRDEYHSLLDENNIDY